MSGKSLERVSLVFNQLQWKMLQQWLILKLQCHSWTSLNTSYNVMILQNSSVVINFCRERSRQLIAIAVTSSGIFLVSWEMELQCKLTFDGNIFERCKDPCCLFYVTWPQDTQTQAVSTRKYVSLESFNCMF